MSCAGINPLMHLPAVSRLVGINQKSFNRELPSIISDGYHYLCATTNNSAVTEIDSMIDAKFQQMKPHQRALFIVNESLFFENHYLQDETNSSALFFMPVLWKPSAIKTQKDFITLCDTAYALAEDIGRNSIDILLGIDQYDVSSDDIHFHVERKLLSQTDILKYTLKRRASSLPATPDKSLIHFGGDMQVSYVFCKISISNGKAYRVPPSSANSILSSVEASPDLTAQMAALTGFSHENTFRNLIAIDKCFRCDSPFLLQAKVAISNLHRKENALFVSCFLDTEPEGTLNEHKNSFMYLFSGHQYQTASEPFLLLMEPEDVAKTLYEIGRTLFNREIEPMILIGSNRRN